MVSLWVAAFKVSCFRLQCCRGLRRRSEASSATADDISNAGFISSAVVKKAPERAPEPSAKAGGRHPRILPAPRRPSAAKPIARGCACQRGGDFFFKGLELRGF